MSEIETPDMTPVTHIGFTGGFPAKLFTTPDGAANWVEQTANRRVYEVQSLFLGPALVSNFIPARLELVEASQAHAAKDSA